MRKEARGRGCEGSSMRQRGSRRPRAGLKRPLLVLGMAFAVSTMPLSFVTTCQGDLLAACSRRKNNNLARGRVARRNFDFDSFLKQMLGGEPDSAKKKDTAGATSSSKADGSGLQKKGKLEEKKEVVKPTPSTYDLQILEPMLEKIRASRRTETYDRLILRPMLERIKKQAASEAESAKNKQEETMKKEMPVKDKPVEKKPAKKEFNLFDPATWG